jgi:GT2 family glycosyltransferase
MSNIIVKRKKIGVGIVTCNREHFFEKCINSVLPSCSYIDELVVVNDGSKLTKEYKHGIFIQNTVNLHVGASKNILMTNLLDLGCDYIFTMEDDVMITDSNIFEKYIKASLTTGIQHFNFGFSQRENLNSEFNPIYRKIIEYKDNVSIVLTKNILGAFTFYTRSALQTIGLHHHSFNKGHGDHLELTYRAAKHGLTTPFWWFADIYGSWNMLSNLSNMTTDSTVRDVSTFRLRFNEARNIFKSLHGQDIFEVVDSTEKDVITFLKDIKP